MEYTYRNEQCQVYTYEWYCKHKDDYIIIVVIWYLTFTIQKKSFVIL